MVIIFYKGTVKKNELRELNFSFFVADMWGELFGALC